MAGVTHFKEPVKLSGKFDWTVEAELDFASPALCGVFHWTSATDKPEETTCPDCLRAFETAPK